MSTPIRNLALLAYKRELEQELSRVREHLEAWRHRENRFFKVDDLKGRYCGETASEIWKIYEGLPPAKIVGRAMRLGLLAREEVPPDIMEVVRASSEPAVN